MRNSFAGVAAALLLAGCASFLHPAPARTAGGVYVDSRGMTLYTFDKDAVGKSACSGQCAAIWPPLLAAADAKPSGDWTLVAREDGRKQWAYKGKPMYAYAKDQKPGERSGDGFNNIWRVARP